MSAHPSVNSPWPAQTPVAAPPPLPPASSLRKRSGKRRKIRDYSLETRGATSKSARQVMTDASRVEKAKRDCQWKSGNDVISCFPTTDTVVPQHQWATFIWNSRRPEITQTNRVDIYLFHGDSLKQLLYYPNQINPTDQAGMVTAQVNDSWWGDSGTKWNQTNITYPFYWVLSRSDKKLDGSQIPQAVFHAVQTTYADSVAMSMSSTASVASASSASSKDAATRTGAGSSPTNVQSNASSSSFPHWAIAVIVVLGFLAIAASCMLTFLITRRIRERNDNRSHRTSVGSASPMIAHTGHSPASPLLVGGTGPGQPSSLGHGDKVTSSVVSPDGASTISESGPFSGADAAIMADAFRKALRKPDFAGRPVEEGESPDHPENGEQRKEELLNRELAEEGRDIRSVSSSRGVKVETMSSSDDHQH